MAGVEGVFVLGVTELLLMFCAETSAACLLTLGRLPRLAGVASDFSRF